MWSERQGVREKGWRQYEEVDVSEVMVCNSATVHGVFIGEVSPVKHSRTKTDVRYFEGKLSDGKKTVWMVSFEQKHWRVVKRWQ